MLQQFATNTAGNAQMWVLDSQPDCESTVIESGVGRRWREGDPVPIRLLLDYDNAVDRCSRNPHRFRPEGMPDDDHAEIVKAFEARQLALSAAPLPPANAPDSPFGWNRPA